jgi:flagellar secretion chaperone FliS
MHGRPHPAIATQHYRALELASRVESASPHGLVALLYEELLQSLDLAIARGRKGGVLMGSPGIAKALSILVALEGSLDPERGGDLATTLARIYRSAARTINEAARNGSAERLSEVRSAISDIAYAWAALSDPGPNSR